MTTTKTKHTQGPWTLEEDSSRFYVRLNQGESYVFNLKDEANARLIACAPELLEACKGQHEAIDRLFALLIEKDNTFFPTKSGQPWEAIRLGKAAISKAEGQS